MSIILLITKFLPLLISIIQLLDRMFPNKGIGPFKFSVAIKVLAAIKPYLTGGIVPLDDLIDKVVPGLINEIVSAMNTHPETWNTPVAIEEPK